MNYDEIVLQLQTMAAVPLNSEDTNFFRILPGAFAYAEGRIHRELNILTTDNEFLVTLVAQERDIDLPENVIHVRSIGICTPTGTVTRNSRRHFPERVSPEALNAWWPQPNFKPGMPKKFTIIGRRVANVIPFAQPPIPVFQPEKFILTARFMPAPDRPYQAEVYGGTEPLPLSQSNPETYVTIHYPELYMAACMIWIAGYQRDYGAQSDDPSRAVSWESQYVKIRDPIQLELAMQRGEAAAWTSLPPAPIAQTPR